jgi:hypothetical protein
LKASPLLAMDKTILAVLVLFGVGVALMWWGGVR